MAYGTMNDQMFGVFRLAALRRVGGIGDFVNSDRIKLGGMFSIRGKSWKFPSRSSTSAGIPALR